MTLFKAGGSISAGAWTFPANTLHIFGGGTATANTEIGIYSKSGSNDAILTLVAQGNQTWNIASNRAGNKLAFYNGGVAGTEIASVLPTGAWTLGPSAGGVNHIVYGTLNIGSSPTGAILNVGSNSAALSYLFDTSNVTSGGSSIWRMITRNIANTGTTSVDFYKPTGSGFFIINNDTHANNFTSITVGGKSGIYIANTGSLTLGPSDLSAAHIVNGHSTFITGDGNNTEFRVSSSATVGGISNLNLRNVNNNNGNANSIMFTNAIGAISGFISVINTNHNANGSQTSSFDLSLYNAGTLTSVASATGAGAWIFGVGTPTHRFNTATATSATAGANGAVPAQVSGYMVVNINGTDRKIPYYV